MGNALLFTACLLGAAALGGFVGSCCASKRREDNGHEARIAELEDRLDALADHAMEEIKKLKDRAGSYEDKMQGVWEWAGELDERLKEAELLIGDTPTGGLLGRVGALEEARLKEALEALKVSQEAFEHNVRGWQEVHGAGAREALRKLDERLTKLEVQGEC